MNCQSCDQPIPEGVTFCTGCGSPVDGSEKIEGKQYKVISQRDKSFFGAAHQFSSIQIQQVLNKHAASGWRLISVCQVEAFSAWQGQKNEVLMFLERG